MTLSPGNTVILVFATTGIAVSAGAAWLLTDAASHALAWTFLLFSLLAGLAWIDAATETVPDVLTLALVATGLAHAAASGQPIIGYLAGSALMLIIGVIHGYLTGDKGWIGSGDFFLIAGIIAWFGPILVLDVLALTSVGLVLHGIVVRRATIALAPSLASAAALIWLGGPLL